MSITALTQAVSPGHAGWLWQRRTSVNTQYVGANATASCSDHVYRGTTRHFTSAWLGPYKAAGLERTPHQLLVEHLLSVRCFNVAGMAPGIRFNGCTEEQRRLP